MPCQLPPAPVENVTDDTISLLCTLAMEKCSKKSEKKKASCGGAAMRKRLLIKNFVAQMLAFERQSSPTDMDEDSSYDNDYENNESDEYHMDSEESGMEMENLKNMDNPPMASMLSTSPEDDIALSMVRRQNDDLYLVPGTSHELYDEFSDKPLSERTNNSYSSWEDYHTVPGREYSSCSTLESEDSVRNSLFSDNLFVHFSSYPQAGCSTLPDTSSLDYSLQAHPRPENFFDGMSINDDGMNCESSCEQGDADCPAEFASLVNLNEPMRFLCRTEAQRELYCRRSITDLDTNTVVEEEDYGLNRSQRKRQVFAQDDLSNYMFLTTSPKRIRL